MSWVRIDDTFPEHLKVVGLSDGAFRLHVAAICYASRNLTDGHIPAGALRGIGGSKRRVSALVDAGLWQGDGHGYLLHDYLDYNRSRGDVEADRDAAKSRMKRVRSKRTTDEVRTNIGGSSPNTLPNGTEEDPPSPSEKAAGERFFEATNRGQEVGALVDVAKAHGRKVSGGIIADALKSHSKTAVMDALMQALGRNAADIGTYMKGVLGNAKAGRRTAGARPVVSAADLEQSTKPPEEGGF